MKLKLMSKQWVKLICSIFLALTGVLPGQGGSSPANAGFVRFINLVDAGTGKTFFEVNGKQLWVGGYKFGQKTGALPYPGGTLKLKVTKEGCLEAERKIDLETGRTQTLISYAEEVFDEDGESLGWQIKIGRLKQHTPEDGIVITLLSFCPEDQITVTIVPAGGGSNYVRSVERQSTTRVLLNETGRVNASIQSEGKEIGGFSVSKEGNYVALVYVNKDGERDLEFFSDPAFMVSAQQLEEEED